MWLVLLVIPRSLFLFFFSFFLVYFFLLLQLMAWWSTVPLSSGWEGLAPPEVSWSAAAADGRRRRWGRCGVRRRHGVRRRPAATASVSIPTDVCVLPSVTSATPATTTTTTTTTTNENTCQNRLGRWLFFHYHHHPSSTLCGILTDFAEC